MNEQTMIWFLQKTARHELSREATSVWMDFYSHLQNQNRACNPRIPFAMLQEVCDIGGDALRADTLPPYSRQTVFRIRDAGGINTKTAGSSGPAVFYVCLDIGLNGKPLKIRL